MSPAGIQASRIAELWHLTVVVCGVVFAAILVALILGVARGRRARSSNEAQRDARGADKTSRRAVIIATACSVAGLVCLVGVDIYTDRALSRLPVGNALYVEMTGHQWWWEVHYPADKDKAGFATANELHIPVGRPVVIALKAADVIHTFWAPALHGKKDMIPGRDSTIALRADRAGTYRGQCAEFCGAEHALMAFSVVAHAPSDYEAWATSQRLAAPAPAGAALVRGQALFMANACAQCHTIRGTDAAGAIGPDLTHLASRPMLAAGTVSNTAEHLAQWISKPDAIKPATTMPGTPLSPTDLAALVAYLETLK